MNHYKKNIGKIISIIKTYKYGWRVLLYNILVTAYPYRKFKNKISKDFLKKKHYYIEKYIIGKYGYVLKKECVKPKKNDNRNIIWIFWWQGTENMPLTVKKCYQSVLKNSNSSTVILITKYNYTEYIKIPEYIIEKFNHGNITITHFSDILRMYLLYNYGGAWLDATIFVSQAINLSLFDYPIYTAKCKNIVNYDNVSLSRWTGFFMFGKAGYPLFFYALSFFYEYWKNEDQLIDYFLIDYIIDIIYNKVSIVEDFKRLKYNNEDIQLLSRHLMDKNSEYEIILRNQAYHKLNWKNVPNELNELNKDTLWAFIMKYYE